MTEKIAGKSYKVLIAAAVVLLAASGIYSYPKWDEWTVWPELRKPILASLKDPDSALFRNQYVGRRALCGEVNARNAMGGYTGYSRFIAAGDQYALESAGLSTWYNKSTGIEGVKAGLDKQIEIMKTKSRRPTDEEVEKAIFMDLWRERCEGLS